MRRQRLILIVVLIAACLLIPFMITNNYWMHIIIMTLIYMTLAASVDISYGYTGLLNLGQAAFYAIGAYATALLMLRLNMSFWVTIPISGVIAAIFGLLLGLPCLRVSGLYLCVVTMAFSEIVRIILLTWVSFTRGPMGLPGIPSPQLGGFVFKEPMEYYYLILGILVITLISIHNLVNSRVGKAWMAIRDDEIAAKAMGINPTYYKLISFAIGAFFAGIAGSFFAVYISFISPDAFKFMESSMIFAMPAIGGPGTLLGPLFGAGLLYILPEVTREFAEYRMLWVGALLVIVMVIYPNGVVGAIKEAISKTKKIT